MSAFLLFIALSGLNRGHSEFFAEGPAKIAHIVETAFFCHLADGQIRDTHIALRCNEIQGDGV